MRNQTRKKNFLLILFFCLIGAVLAPAVQAEQQWLLRSLDDRDSHLYEIADLYHERAGKFACESVRYQIEEIKQRRNEDLAADLRSEIETLEGLVGSENDLEVRQHLLSLRKGLKDLEQSGDAKPKIIKALEAVCEVVRKPSLAVGRSLLIANSLAFNAAMTPFNSLLQLFGGAFGSRERETLSGPNDFVYHAMGPKKSLPLYLLTSLGGQALSIVLSVNPVFIAINASYMVEMITHYQCRNVNETDDPKLKFCKTYHKVKELFFKPAQAAHKLGKKIQALMDARIIRKRANFPISEFCRFREVRQVKRAKQALKRYRYFKDDKRFLGVQVILPIHKNDCTKFAFYFDGKLPSDLGDQTPEQFYQAKIEKFKKEKKDVEGIEIVYLADSWYPKEYYYTIEELGQMPLSDQFCHEVEQSHLARKAQVSGKLYANFLKSALAPSLLGAPDTQKVVTEDKDILKGDVAGKRNIIFSIGPRNQDLSVVEALVDERERLHDDVNWIGKKLKKKKTFERCKKYIADNDVNLKDLETKLLRIKTISADSEVQKYQELVAVRKFVKKGNRNLKLKWEMIETNNIIDVHSFLRSQDVANVIIISHGKEDGFLVDSYGQEYPKGFFSELSPSLMSLNFYSCYSQDLVELYDLKRKMKTSPSFYKIRYLTSVSENNFFDSSSFAPVSAFADYLRELDRYLDRGTKGAVAVQKEFSDDFGEYQAERQCWMDVSDIKVQKGTYAITLNKNFVGVFSEHQPYGDLYFPCRFLKEDNNSLKVKNIVNAGGSIIENLKTFTIKIEDFVLTDEHARLRRNSYMSFKF